MAIPTIVSVSPVTGPAAGGNLVTVTGTNFRLPVVPYAIPTPAAVPTVRVTVNGRVSEQVDVISATSLRFRAPRLWHTAVARDTFAPVSVTIENLDSNGVLIAGETVTAGDAYTYARWELGSPREDPPLHKITRELLWALKTDVERQTHSATYVEYADEGSAVEINIAKLPSINITVNTPRDIEYSAWDNYPEEVERPDGSIWVFRGARTHMLEINMYLAGTGSREARFLTAAVEEFVQVNPLITVSADQTLYPGEEDQYPVEITRDAMLTSSPNVDSVVVYNMQLRVRGISVLPSEPTDIIKTIQEVILAMSDLEATAPIEMELT